MIARVCHSFDSIPMTVGAHEQPLSLSHPGPKLTDFEEIDTKYTSIFVELDSQDSLYISESCLLQYHHQLAV
jgi:hypothetical protein